MKVLFRNIKFNYNIVSKQNDEDILPLFEIKNKKLSKL